MYERGVLVQGTLTYTASREVTEVQSCRYESAQWVAADGSACNVSFIEIPRSSKEVQALINAGTLKPLGDACQHREICYVVE